LQFFNFSLAAVCGISKKTPVDMHKILLASIRLDISSDSFSFWPKKPKVQILRPDFEKLEMFRNWSSG